MKIFIIVNIFLILIHGLWAEDIDQANEVVDGVDDFSYVSDFRQSFVAGKSAYLIGIEIPVSKINSPGSLNLHLFQSDTNNSLIGTQIGSGNLNADKVPTGLGISAVSWVRIELDEAYFQTAGENLTFYFTEPTPYGGGDGYYFSGYSSSDNYLSGDANGFYSYAVDMAFRTIVSDNVSNVASDNTASVSDSELTTGDNTSISTTTTTTTDESSSSNFVADDSSLFGDNGTSSDVSVEAEAPVNNSDSGGGGGCLLKQSD